MNLRLLFSLCLVLGYSFFAYSKEPFPQVKNAIFFGVDFSHCEIIGADESENQCREAFAGINRLFFSEPKKYDISESIQIPTDLVFENIKVANNENEQFVLSLKAQIETIDPFDNETLEQLIKTYTNKDKEGHGFVIFAKALDKTQGKAYYSGCLFEIKTGKIIYQDFNFGKARGYGLRNFWARSVYNYLSNFKLHVPKYAQAKTKYDRRVQEDGIYQ